MALSPDRVVEIFLDDPPSQCVRGDTMDFTLDNIRSKLLDEGYTYFPTSTSIASAVRRLPGVQVVRPTRSNSGTRYVVHRRRRRAHGTS